jgi:peptide/nickel transport system substrate-binding protein
MQDTPQDQTDPQPTSPDPVIAPDIAPITPSSPPVTTEPLTSSHNNRRKTWLIILILVVLAGAAAAVAYSKHHHKQAAVKKDIPYLTVGSNEAADLTHLYPTETVDTDSSTEINMQLFESLVRYQGGIKITPLLATSWDNPDNSTWVFNLRHDVKFHSGRTMTAADVKYSLDYAVAHQGDYSGATLMSVASTIGQVTVVNPYQVKITTNGPDPTLLNRLAYLYILDSKAKLGDPNAGSGPYIVKPGTTPSMNSMYLAANNSYWGGHIYTREVYFQMFTSSDQLITAINKGQFDIAGDFTTKQLSSINNYQPLIEKDFGVDVLGLNTLKVGSPMTSLAARQAASYALNIPAIIKAGGQRGVQVSQLIPLAIPGYDPSIRDIPYNPAKAKQLLAGVPNVAAPLTLSYPSGDDGQVAEIAKELNAVGFNVKISVIADINTEVNAALAGQLDMYFIGDSTGTLDGLQLINDLVVSGTGNYSNATVTDLANQAGSTLDPSARIAILQKISRQVAKDIPTIPLYAPLRTSTLTTTKHYHVQVDIPSIEPGVYFWQVYQQ